MMYPLIILPISSQLYGLIIGLLALAVGSLSTWLFVDAHGVVLRYLTINGGAMVVAWFAMALGYRVMFADETVYLFARREVR